jgi:antitoxin (DNA-binding transcriptional repressor) of toxin-antitoxin stability system
MDMKTVTIGEFKANLSAFAEKIAKGESIIVTKGRKKKKIFKVSPYREKRLMKRKLGLLKNKATVTFAEDFKMTPAEFLGS